MAFITVVCCRRLTDMHISAARDMVSRYDIAFITKDFVRSYVRRAQSLDVILTVRCLLELLYVSQLFTALHVMQTRYGKENSVCLSVCPSVRHTRGL